MWVYEYIIRHGEREERRGWWKQAEELAYEWTRQGLQNVRIFYNNGGKEQDMHWVPEESITPPK